MCVCVLCLLLEADKLNSLFRLPIVFSLGSAHTEKTIGVCVLLACLLAYFEFGPKFNLNGAKWAECERASQVAAAASCALKLLLLPLAKVSSIIHWCSLAAAAVRSPKSARFAQKPVERKGRTSGSGRLNPVVVVVVVCISGESQSGAFMICLDVFVAPPTWAPISF